MFMWLLGLRRNCYSCQCQIRRLILEDCQSLSEVLKLLFWLFGYRRDLFNDTWTGFQSLLCPDISCLQPSLLIRKNHLSLKLDCYRAMLGCRMKKWKTHLKFHCHLHHAGKCRQSWLDLRSHSNFGLFLQRKQTFSTCISLLILHLLHTRFYQILQLLHFCMHFHTLNYSIKQAELFLNLC